MRKNVTLLFLCLFSMVHAQYLEMLSGNPQWVYCFVYNGSMAVPPSYRIIGSFEANGKTYHKLYRIDMEFVDDGTTGFVECPIYPVGVREENGKVYAYHKDYIDVEKELRESNYFKTDKNPYLLTDDGEVLLYDFTLEEGDKYPTSSDDESIIVNSIELVRTADGISRKLFTLSNGIKILEGIGCLNTDDILFYLYNHHTILENLEKDGGYYTLFTYTKNEQVVYSVGITDDLRSIVRTTPRTPKSIYDLQGRRLTTQPRRGIYVKDGKKVVVK